MRQRPVLAAGDSDYDPCDPFASVVSFKDEGAASLTYTIGEPIPPQLHGKPTLIRRFAFA
jgi:hypothetical protein